MAVAFSTLKSALSFYRRVTPPHILLPGGYINVVP
jgi:hypothetical protein